MTEKMEITPVEVAKMITEIIEECEKEELGNDARFILIEDLIKTYVLKVKSSSEDVSPENELRANYKLWRANTGLVAGWVESDYKDEYIKINFSDDTTMRII